MISLKQSWNFVTVHKKLFMILGLFALTFIVVPEIANAQTGSIKISSLSDVEAKAEEGSNTILNIAKYVLGAVLGVALSGRVIIFFKTAKPAHTNPTPISIPPASLNSPINALTSAANSIISI